MASDDENGLLHLAKQAIPLVDRATKVVRTYQAKRLAAWWQAFVQRDDAAVADTEVEDEIFSAIAGGDEKTVQAIREGSKAAADSIDAVVLPAIARIGRDYARGNVPAWFQRSSLAYLSSVSAEEYGELRDFLQSLVAAVAGRSLPTLLVSMGSSPGVQVGGGNASLPIKRVENVIHVFGELRRHGLGHANQAHQGSSSPYVILLEMRVVRWLADAIR